MYDIIIIGAGCAGLTASIYAARAGKSILVLEAENIGGQISYSPRIENYPGIKKISGGEFADNLYEQAISLGVEIDFERVEGIYPNGNLITVIAGKSELKCKSVIIATGVKHRKLGIKHEDDLSGKGVSYCAICDGAFYKDTDVAVVGGGNSALQGAELLSSYCRNVYLIHHRDSFRGEQKLADRLEIKDNIKFILNSVVNSIEGSEFLETVVLSDVHNKEEMNIKIEGLFVLIGQIPDNRNFEDMIELDETGYIVAGEDCKTSLKGVFAAGDCRVKPIRQLTTASADGTISAIHACQYINSLFN